MSAIFGIFHLDGKPVEQRLLAAMDESLAPRGPDGRGTWIEGSVALGHRLLCVTPESLHEKQPTANADGTLVITADARIDNRDELIAALGTAGKAPETLTDPELILLAYERWREQCVEHLLGDFAFAIWDQRAQQLFCARDHFGVRPFYYFHAPGRLFAFASEMKALFEIPGVPHDVNEQMIARYLLQEVDHTATFYRDILRLTPAHEIAVSKAGLKRQRYWQFEPEREINLPSDEAYAEALKEIFSEAVRCRLRSAYPIGSNLSGGLDSSSIVCFAREILRQSGGGNLHTFSMAWEKFRTADEREFMQEVVAGGGVTPHWIAADSWNLLENRETLSAEMEDPFWGFGAFLYAQLHHVVGRHGVRVLLDGNDGDMAVGYGDEIAVEHLRTGHWIAACREMMQIAEVTQQPGWPMVKDFLHRACPEPVIQGWRRLKRSLPTAPHTVIQPAFARRLGLAVELPRRRQPPQTTRRTVIRQWDALTYDAAALGFEMGNKVAVPHGVDPRYPFWDKRLLEFCLALPVTQKFHRGWNRIVLRRAVKGVVPEKIRWRGTKSNNSPFLMATLLAHGRALFDDVIYGSPSLLAGYVDMELLRQQYKACLAGSRPAFDVVWAPVAIGLWLRDNGFGRANLSSQIA